MATDTTTETAMPRLKARYRGSLQGVLDRPKAAMAAAGAAVLVAAARRQPILRAAV